MSGLFITGTGTGVGKTWLSRGLTSALRRRGQPVVAIKPIETGCDPTPEDAVALAQACGRPELAEAHGLYRARLSLSPYAVTLAGEAPLEFESLVAATQRLVGDRSEFALIEGAGGLLVPLDRERTVADFAAALGYSIVLVARDELGVLSYALSACEVALQRGLQVAAVVLTSSPSSSVRCVSDPSVVSNRAILAERLPCPVLSFSPAKAEDDSLGQAAEPLLGRIRARLPGRLLRER